MLVITGTPVHQIGTRLAEFRARHPLIDLRLQTTDKDVELPGNGMFLGILVSAALLFLMSAAALLMHQRTWPLGGRLQSRKCPKRS